MTFVHHQLALSNSPHGCIIGQCTGCGWVKMGTTKSDILIAFATHDLDEPQPLGPHASINGYDGDVNG